MLSMLLLLLLLGLLLLLHRAEIAGLTSNATPYPPHLLLLQLLFLLLN